MISVSAWEKDVKRWTKAQNLNLSSCKNVLMEKKLRFYLGGKYKNIYFTARELDVAKHLEIKKTALEIAVALSLSRRTIEEHIKKMRLKLGCKTKKELQEVITQMNLSKLLR